MEHEAQIVNEAVVVVVVFVIVVVVVVVVVVFFCLFCFCNAQLTCTLRVCVRAGVRVV